eukprot:179086-Pelagomonas_calceolata.AAC.1
MQKRENREWLGLDEFAPPAKQPRLDQGDAGTAGLYGAFGEGSSFTPGRGGGRFGARGGGFRGGGAGRGAGRGAGPYFGNGSFRGGRGAG